MTIPLAFFLGIAIGGNDICNSMGTAYGCQAISMKQALILGVIFESLGALTLGANVSKTISGKILDINSFLKLQNIYALNMPAVLAAAAFSSLAVTIYGLPVSITQGVVFGMAAVGITSIGWSSVQYTGIGNIMIALIFSPFAGVLFALGMYYFMIKVIKQHEDSYKRATQFLPIFGFFNVFVVVFMVMYKGIDIKPLWIGLLVAILVGLIVAGILYIYGQKISKRDYSQFKSLKDEQEKEIMTGKIFKPLLIISACCVSFTHGSNDVSNCVGPLASVLNVYKNKDLNHEVDIPFWTLLLGASAFSIGICLIGKRTIKTMGKGVTSMIPMKACTVQMGTATAILIASAIGMPVSTSHCTIGSLLGATLAEKLNGLQFTFKKKSIKKIFASWIYTIPFVFLIAIYIYYALKGTIIKIEDYV